MSAESQQWAMAQDFIGSAWLAGLEELAYASCSTQPRLWAQAFMLDRCILWRSEALRACLTVQACSDRDRILARCSHGSASNAPSSKRRLMACFALPGLCHGLNACKPRSRVLETSRSHRFDAGKRASTRRVDGGKVTLAMQ
jgi:hypothetical protein